MTVTFTAGPDTTPRWRISCGDTRRRDPRTFDTHEQATAALPSHYPCRCVSCEDWRDAHVELHRTDRPAISVGDRDGAHLFEHLGYVTPEEQTNGTSDALHFLGRVLTALALMPADAIHTAASTVPDGTQGVLWHQASTRTDYLHELHALAEWCTLHGRVVTWS